LNNVYTINEIYTNGFFIENLNIISFIAILCGILVITSKNPIVSLLFLIALFASISSYLILIGLTFIGLSYLIIYIGAVSILFLFILMLINIRISELQNNTSNSIVLGIIVIFAFNYLLYNLLPSNITIFNNYNNIINTFFLNFTKKIYYQSSIESYNYNVFFSTSKT
jgi:NADH-ubiquinone oxidoreductase chain 6